MTDLANAVLVLAAVVVILLATAVLYRVVVGPTTHDRVVAINVIGTSIVIVLALVAAGLDRPEYLDIAIVYAILNFVLSLVVGRFSYRSGEVEWR
ncbi:cation:proton antiporter [Natronobacterium gregoryi]|uniref:Cation:proton antiporter n=2 Tax=Natronobacterium gregoryi TaxID=44930 RepID=L0AL81_NATGS|nr:cation:proton antiporter [Natronobacterium gregoryi]AFZ74199.1 multisubunit Na+/H+ antiporter, MnhF subunit [Natronobacterium gregoryi SP2]ELY63654.1 monovalent cation/H+ antiporter subunit F [Natronobacterium gregoryi SP2]PLK22011.1 cation:proton antiporter [Natronobacterium gregoryi SP2]SFI51332.1 multisubunit sodium/proton antiporter, MrpF subunit [Natronobacterium gregoryi]